MNPNKADIEALLIDHHFDQATTEQTQQLNELLAKDEELAKANKALGALLGRLDEYTVDVPGPSLMHDVLDRVHNDLAANNFQPQAVAGRIGYDVDQPAPATSPLVRLREIAAVAACLVLMATIFNITSNKIRATDQQFKCSNNLAGMARGISNYITGNNDFIPYVGTTASQWVGTDGHPRKSKPHLFTLIKNGYVTPDMVVCPATTARQLTAAQIHNHNDFPSPMTVSYSFQNTRGLNPDCYRMTTLRPVAHNMPVMADSNPLFADGTIHDRVDVRAASPNHSSLDGQCVLYLDGHVRWASTPMVGPEEDNIWQAGDLVTYRGTETPTCGKDAFLAP